MRGALIGFGTIALGHLLGYQDIDDINICAVVDSTPERLRKARAHLPDARMYATIDELFKHETLDFIDICVPPYAHYDYMMAGLARQCHVICEKPVLFRPEEYLQPLQAAKSAGKLIYPSHNYQFSPAMRFLTERVASGELGELQSGHFRTLRKGHACGVDDWNPHWRRQRDIAGGGILYDHGPHSLYLASHLCRKTPLAVACTLGRLANDEYAETEDTIMMTIDFGGLHWLIDLTWHAGRRQTRYAIVGANGHAVVDGDSIQSSIGGVAKRETIASDFDNPLHKTWFHQMFLDFLAQSAAPQPAYGQYRESLLTTLLIAKAYESADCNGEWIEIPSLDRYLDA
jgi:predicted dehydrogenase